MKNYLKIQTHTQRMVGDDFSRKLYFFIMHGYNEHGTVPLVPELILEF